MDHVPDHMADRVSTALESALMSALTLMYVMNIFFEFLLAEDLKRYRSH